MPGRGAGLAKAERGAAKRRLRRVGRVGFRKEARPGSSRRAARSGRRPRSRGKSIRRKVRPAVRADPASEAGALRRRRPPPAGRPGERRLPRRSRLSSHPRASPLPAARPEKRGARQESARRKEKEACRERRRFLQLRPAGCDSARLAFLRAAGSLCLSVSRRGGSVRSPAAPRRAGNSRRTHPPRNDCW